MPVGKLPPSTQIKVLRRGLHVMALLQNDQDDWNYSSLTNCIESDPPEMVDPAQTLDTKNVKDAVKTIVKKFLGCKTIGGRGRRKMSLESKIEGQEMVEILSLYSNFVVHDSSRIAIFESLLRKNPDKCLWILAKLYFASKKGRTVSFKYETNKQIVITPEVNPYHVVSRNNNMYLVGLHEGILKLFILTRISELKETGGKFEIDNIPAPEDIFKHSLGSFVSDEVHEVRIKYDQKIRNMLMDVFSSLDPVFTVEKDIHYMEISACDLQTVCKQLFLFGSDVEIVSTPHVRKYMISMLKKSGSVYGDT